MELKHKFPNDIIQIILKEIKWTKYTVYLIYLSSFNGFSLVTAYFFALHGFLFLLSISYKFVMQLHTCMKVQYNPKNVNTWKIYIFLATIVALWWYLENMVSMTLTLFHEAVKTYAKQTYLFWQNIFMIPDVLACKLRL